MKNVKVQVWIYVWEKKYGFVHELVLSCNNCDFPFITFLSQCLSTKTTKSPLSINRRAVHAATALGKGHSELELFSTYMNISVMESKTFRRHVKQVVCATKLTAKYHLKEIHNKVQVAHIAENPQLQSHNNIDITVSYDGS